MLLVARRVGEALRIGTDIEVKVVAATRSRVMLAVTAPRELTIRRIYGKADYKKVGESGAVPEATEEVVAGPGGGIAANSVEQSAELPVATEPESETRSGVPPQKKRVPAD